VIAVLKKDIIGKQNEKGRKNQSQAPAESLRGDLHRFRREDGELLARASADKTKKRLLRGS